METEEIKKGRVHHGRNIRRTRIEKNIKQDALSKLVNMSQPTVSRYESMRVVEDEILERFAKALKVPVEYLQTLEEDASTIVFENNTINNKDQGGANTQVGFVDDSIDDKRTNYFNPIDKITELYERLLKEKDEKYETLEKRLHDLEQKTNIK